MVEIRTRLVSWCFEPSRPQRITLGMNTNFTRSQSYSFTSHHITSHVFFLLLFFSQYIFHGHSTREPASSKVTYSILRAYTGTSVSQSQHRKKIGRSFGKNGSAIDRVGEGENTSAEGNP